MWDGGSSEWGRGAVLLDLPSLSAPHIFTILHFHTERVHLVSLWVNICSGTSEVARGFVNAVQQTGPDGPSFASPPHRLNRGQ